MGNINIKQSVWDLSPLAKGDDDPAMALRRKTVKEKSDQFIAKWKERDDYLREPSVLKEALDDYEAWRKDYGTAGAEGYYFLLRTEQDQNNPDLKAKFNIIEDFGNKIGNDMNFFELRLAKIVPGEQSKFLNAESLEPYRHFLERLFVASKHLLSEPEEKILTLEAPGAYSHWVTMVAGFLSREERMVAADDGVESPKNFQEIMSLMNSQNKKTRDSAAAAFNDILIKHADSAEEEMNAVLAYKKVNDELRGFSRPDASRHMDDDIESGIVDALIDSVAGRFDIAQKYYALKAELLGVSKLAYHERNVPYGKTEKEYPFPDAANLANGVFHELDPKFSEIFSSFLARGQMDIYPKKGKRGGAFCIAELLSLPTYILLNHTNTLKDVLTLAHETGHGINNEFMREKQNALNFGTPMATAEVASTFMEDFVFEKIAEEADPELRLAVMMMKLNEDISTIFRQVACYKFEQDIHAAFREAGYLSKERIGELFLKNMAAYMGAAVQQSAGSENWWIYWSHIRSFFYVYSYASGLLISKAMQRSVRADHAFIEKVKVFLSAGRSESPVNIFRTLGIDISKKEFWDNGLEEINDALTETIALAKKLKKIA